MNIKEIKFSDSLEEFAKYTIKPMKVEVDDVKYAISKDELEIKTEFLRLYLRTRIIRKNGFTDYQIRVFLPFCVIKGEPVNLQSTLLIGNIIQNARVFSLRNWHGGTVSTNILPQTVAQFFTLLHQRQIDYVLVGDIAMLQYVEGRNTEDIDLIIALSSLQELPEVEITSQDADFARGQFGELQVDFLLTSNPLFDKVRCQYTTPHHFMEHDILCATVEGLILLKLYALPFLYRQGEFARVGLYENDIATLNHYYQPKLSPLFDELASHLSDTDVAALREIVAELEPRFERFRKGFDKNVDASR